MSSARPYFSSSTGGLVMSVMRLQYQIMMMRMLGVRNVFMANQTFVKPPFWWIALEQKTGGAKSHTMSKTILLA